MLSVKREHCRQRRVAKALAVPFGIGDRRTEFSNARCKSANYWPVLYRVSGEVCLACVLPQDSALLVHVVTGS